MKEISKCFIRFLKDGGLYVQYKRNLAQHKKNKQSVSDFLTETEAEKYLHRAFTWAGTTEGHMIWSTAANSWINFLSLWQNTQR